MAVHAMMRRGTEPADTLITAAARRTDAVDRQGHTALMLAVLAACYPAIVALVRCGALVDARDAEGETALMKAARHNNLAAARFLIHEGGADLSFTSDRHAETALLQACRCGHTEMVELLLRNGAGIAIETSQQHSAIALRHACFGPCSDLKLARLIACYAPMADLGHMLSTTAASRKLTTTCRVDERGRGIDEWIRESRAWFTPLHHLAWMPSWRALELLRGSADLHAALLDKHDDIVVPTPLQLASALIGRGEAPDGSSARLVFSAAQPWSPSNHHLYACEARARASDLLRAGWLTSRRVVGSEQMSQMHALLEVWIYMVMPLCVAPELGRCQATRRQGVCSCPRDQLT